MFWLCSECSQNTTTTQPKRSQRAGCNWLAVCLNQNQHCNPLLKVTFVNSSISAGKASIEANKPPECTQKQIRYEALKQTIGSYPRQINGMNPDLYCSLRPSKYHRNTINQFNTRIQLRSEWESPQIHHSFRPNA